MIEANFYDGIGWTRLDFTKTKAHKPYCLVKFHFSILLYFSSDYKLIIFWILVKLTIKYFEWLEGREGTLLQVTDTEMIVLVMLMSLISKLSY